MSLVKKLIIVGCLLFVVTIIGLSIFVFSSGGTSKIAAKLLGAYFEMRYQNQKAKQKEVVAESTAQLQKNPKDLLALKARADAYLELGEYTLCKNDCDKLMHLDPKNTEWLEKKAQALTEDGDSDNKETIKVLSELIAKQAEDKSAWTYLERARHYQYGDQNKACQADLDATKDLELNADELKKRADLYIDIGNYEQGQLDLKAIVENRENEQYERLPALEKLCACLMYKDTIKAALKKRLDFLQIETDNKDERSLPTGFYYETANLSLASGEKEKASEFYEKSRENEFGTSLEIFAKALELRALLDDEASQKESSGHYMDLLSFLIQDIDSNWDNQALTRILKRLSPEERARFIKEAIPAYQAIAKERSEAPCALSILYTADGQSDKALEQLKASENCSYAIIAKLEAENFTKSLDLANELNESASGNSCRALILLSQKKNAAAQKLYDDSKGEFCDDAGALYRMSRVARLLGRKDEAQDFLLKAAAMGNFEALRQIKTP